MDPENRHLRGNSSFMYRQLFFTCAFRGPPSGIQVSLTHSLRSASFCPYLTCSHHFSHALIPHMQNLVPRIPQQIPFEAPTTYRIIRRKLISSLTISALWMLFYVATLPSERLTRRLDQGSKVEHQGTTETRTTCLYFGNNR